jgi:cardiolipin synthase
MIHAKTAVADQRFVRVGSTNLNLSSWVGNWELDVVIEHAGLAARMEEIYDHDLRNATEIVITERNTVRLRSARPRRLTARDRLPRRRLARAASGSANRVIKDVALAGSALGSAVRGYRVLGPHEALSLSSMGVVAVLIAVVAFAWPRAFAYPVGAAFVLAALTLFGRAWRLVNHKDTKTRRRTKN